MGRDVITCHILDTVVGKPAGGVKCTLVKLSGVKADTISTATTDQDGRVTNWDSPLDSIKTSDGKVAPGTYRIKFDTGMYLSQNNNGQAFFPYVEVVFNIENPDSHYHIPLLLSNYSYSTYRGS
uniref:5-hydroxyisourate hydrolase n=1 Tax=Blastobotrys adeninivorans TaxID=409370 RepID=A0A060TID4_BLAAD